MDLLERELDEVGIRLNQKKPDIYFKIKKGGGVGFNSTLPLTHCDEKMVRTILAEYKIHNAESGSQSALGHLVIPHPGGPDRVAEVPVECPLMLARRSPFPPSSRSRRRPCRPPSAPRPSHPPATSPPWAPR